MPNLSKYKKEYDKLARILCEKIGATDQELAEAFEVSQRTIHNWRARHESFRLACMIGKDVADDRVEMSLYHRANGYTHDDIDIRAVDGVIVQTPIKKHYPPDVTACIFWLKNRRREQWRANPEDYDGADAVAHALAKIAKQLPGA